MSPSAPRAHILIFAKTPRAGKVKTRLARSIGHRAAVNAYLELCQRTIEAALATDLTVEIWVSGPLSHPLWLRARRAGCRIRNQVTGDLGRRMLTACLHSQRENGGLSPAKCAPLVLIGCDCPTLTAANLRQAAQSFYDKNSMNSAPTRATTNPTERELKSQSSYALQPSKDGGYVLLGVQRNYCQLFQRKPWSSNLLTKQTKRAINQQAARLYEMPITYDVDTVRDWKMFRRQQ